MRYVILISIIGLSGCYDDKLTHLELSRVKIEDRLDRMESALKEAMLTSHQRSASKFDEICDRFFRLSGKSGFANVKEGDYKWRNFFPEYEYYCTDGQIDSRVPLKEVERTLELLDKCNSDCQLESAGWKAVPKRKTEGP